MREVEEETGWRPKSLHPLGSCNADNGLVDLRSFLFRADGADFLGEPADKAEAARVEWIPLADVPGMLSRNLILDAPVMITLLLVLLSVKRPG